MLERIVPATVITAESFTDPAGVMLFPAEQAVIARAVAKLRNEFATVRYCARLALAQLGLPMSPLVPGAQGAPHWPEGIVGSMTHCHGYRAAAVARAVDVRTVGIDAEPHAPLPDGVLDLVTRPSERVQLGELAGAFGSIHWDRLFFSAKESVYKAWFPLTGQWLGFEDADLVVDPEMGTFEARLLKAAATVEEAELTGFSGRWIVADGIVSTAIVLLTSRGHSQTLTQQPSA
jgi:4'-phosphopantetheinyl transferase EntD